MGAISVAFIFSMVCASALAGRDDCKVESARMLAVIDGANERNAARASARASCSCVEGWPEWCKKRVRNPSTDCGCAKVAQYCAVSCNVCQKYYPGCTGTPNCADKADWCPRWTHKCDDSYYKVQCKKSCKQC